MTLTAPRSGAGFRAALAFQSAEGMAASVPATRIPLLSAPRPAGERTIDPGGLGPGVGFRDTRGPAIVALEPRVTVRLVAEPTTLAVLLESVTAGTPVTAAGVTTFAWAAIWSRWLTLWVGDGTDAVRWADAAVTRLTVSSSGDEEPAVVEAEFASMQRSVISDPLGTTGAPIPAQWSHAGHAGAANSVDLSSLRSSLVVEVEHVLHGGFWSDADPGLPEAIIRQRANVRVEGSLPQSTESAGRAAAALAGSTHAEEWSWSHGGHVLRAAFDRGRTAEAGIAGFEAGDPGEQPFTEEGRAGTTDAQEPATITIEEV